MALSKTASICLGCPISDICPNKKLEALAYMEPVVAEVSADMTQPIMRETMRINVGGVMQMVFKDEIQETLNKAHFPERHIGLNYGA